MFSCQLNVKSETLKHEQPTAFRDAKGFLLKDKLPHNNIVNGQYYADVLIKN